MTTVDSTPTTSDLVQPSSFQIVLTTESAAYIVVALVAILLRVPALGVAPLDPSEAAQAIAAANTVGATFPVEGTIDNVLGFGGTVLTFLISGPTNTGARLISTLAGLLLVFAPLLFRDRIGRFPTLITSIILTLSPLAVGTSRQSSGIALTMLATLLALAILWAYLDDPRRGKSRLWALGLALAVILLGDFSGLLVLFTLFLGALAAWFTDELGDLDSNQIQLELRRFPVAQVGLAFALSMLGLGTLFFLTPSGLGAVADQLGRLGQGFLGRPVGATYLGTVLAIYEPLILIFGLLGAWQAAQSAWLWQRFLAGWGFAALLIGLVFPGALPLHGLWTVVPLASLSGLYIADLLVHQREAQPAVPWLHALATILIIGTMVLNLANLIRQPTMFLFPPFAPPGEPTSQIPVEPLLIALELLFLIVAWFIAASVAGARSAWRGFSLGLLGLALIVAVGQSVSLAYVRPSQAYEPFHVAPAQPALHDLVAVIEEVSGTSAGHPRQVSITVPVDADPTLLWALRDFDNVAYVEVVNPTVQSTVVLTIDDGSDPLLGETYVGQDFVIVRRWTPRGLTASQWVDWALYRHGPLGLEQRVIVWITEDVYRLLDTSG
ncbi:MAG: hypothetical protein GYB68_05205 [Chloroflexi bacterium]|nr:hypothetical protein [Chloroflexota bacterium]